MADFVAVLRKTIGTLGENTPEMREKVFEKARSTIEAKLAAIDPPPPFAVVDRQRKALEDAIAVVRADYDKPAGADKDIELEDVFASLKSMGDMKAPAAPSPSAAPAPPVLPRANPIEPAAVSRPGLSPAPAAAQPPVAVAPTSRPDPVLGLDDEPDPVVAPSDNDIPAAPERRVAKPAARRRTGTFAALAAVLLVVAGGSYALWLNRDDLFGQTPPSSPVAEAPEEDSVTTAEELSETPPDEQTGPAGQDVAAAPEPQPETPAANETPAAPAAPAEEPKFTQRLLPDGSEVDEGPAGGARTVGEGTSVASAAQPSQPDASAGEQSEAETATAPATAEPQPAEPTTPAVAVGQRAIFYEERTNSAQGSAEMGSIVWSVVQESPGGGLPAEPAIRAEATVPDKDVQLRMTIRRNGDQTLPASHIVEMIFLTPDGFEGGSIANVSRISFKETEQAAGNALAGIPAKIADGFFLIALGDTPAELDANMNLLRRQSWIDIPIVYQTGRRALLTLEKGIPGERVFEEAVRAWTEASSG